jgi:heat shock protein HslJ
MKFWSGLAGFVGAVAMASASARAQDSQFPLDSELILDVAPMRGSKRIPNIDVAANGAIVLEMWCNRAEGQIVVAGNTIAVTFTSGTPRDCPPERVAADRELLTALAEVTTWRRNGGTLMLIGPRMLQFRIPTN